MTCSVEHREDYRKRNVRTNRARNGAGTQKERDSLQCRRRDAAKHGDRETSEETVADVFEIVLPSRENDESEGVEDDRQQHHDAEEDGLDELDDTISCVRSTEFVIIV